MRVRQGLASVLPGGLRFVKARGCRPKPCLLCWWHIWTPRSSEHWFSGTATVWSAISGMLWIMALNFAVHGGLMGIWAILVCAVYQSNSAHKNDRLHLRRWMDGRLRRTSQVEWSLPALCKYLMNCLEAGWVSLGAEVTQSEGSDESVWCHSCYQTVHPPTKKAFKHISSTKSKPHCLTSIKPIKNSQRRKQSTFNCQHELIHGLFFSLSRSVCHFMGWDGAWCS